MARCTKFWVAQSLNLRISPTLKIKIIAHANLYFLSGYFKNMWISGQYFVAQRFCYLTQWRCELTPYSHWVHLNISSSVHNELTQWAHRRSTHSELTATTAWWAHRVISWIAHSKLTVWVANSQRAHSKLTVWAHLVSFLWQAVS